MYILHNADFLRFSHYLEITQFMVYEIEIVDCGYKHPLSEIHNGE